MLSLANPAGFNVGLDKWLEAVEKEADEALRGLASYAFQRILWQTPQWYGTAVANWRIGINVIDSSFDPLIFRLPHRSRAEAKQQGHPDAIAAALLFNEGRIAQARLGDQINITNSLRSVTRTYLNDEGTKEVHGEPYVQYLEENRAGFLRPENEPGHMVEHAARDIEDHFPLLSSALIRRLNAFTV